MKILNLLMGSDLYQAKRNAWPFRVFRYLKYAWFPIPFPFVQIETLTVCNRKCVYCPNYSVGRPERFMEESVFFKIINTLKQHDFRGGVVFSGFGEPLIDKRLANFVSYAERELPHTLTYILTNGDFFTMDKYIELKNAGMDVFWISQHSKELSNHIAMTIKSIKERFPQEQCVGINDIYNTEFKSNRGGLVNVKIKTKIGCDFPSMLTVDYAGNIILCFNDYNSSVVFGNINKDDLYSVWYSRNFINVRSKIRSGFLPYEMCKKCCGR